MGVVKLHFDHMPALMLKCAMNNTRNDPPTTAPYPLPVDRALSAAERACADEGGAACHDAVLRLAGVVTDYLGAVAVGQYSQALYTDQIGTDPTLTRSLQSLRRVLTGQWLLWTAKGLAATPDGPVSGLSGWYELPQSGDLADAYATVRGIMVDLMAYTGEYGARGRVSPRTFLEVLDQYVIRRGKMPADTLDTDTLGATGSAILAGLHMLLQSGTSLTEYELYAPQQRLLLMGSEATTPMPPIGMVDAAAETATLLLYPPGEKPDYTKRPNLQTQRLPLFPLDPLLAYLYCRECDTYQVAALREVANGVPTYAGLDPQCGHSISVED